METNYPFYFFLASLYVAGLNLIRMCQSSSELFSFVVTASVFVLWGISIYLGFKQSDNRGRTCIRLSLLVVFLFLLYCSYQWIETEIRLQSSYLEGAAKDRLYAIGDKFFLVYMFLAMPFVGLWTFTGNDFLSPFLGYGILLILIWVLFAVVEFRTWKTALK